MQVAHGIDLEDVGKHWHQEHVRDETKRVMLEVLHPIQWSQGKWYEVHAEHEDTGKSEQTEVMICAIFKCVWFIKAVVWIITIKFLCRLVEALIRQKDYNAGKSGQSQETHDPSNHCEVVHSAVDRHRDGDEGSDENQRKIRPEEHFL